MQQAPPAKYIAIEGEVSLDLCLGGTCGGDIHEHQVLEMDYMG